jgi:methylamine dehydrogenase heavy chain
MKYLQLSLVRGRLPAALLMGCLVAASISAAENLEPESSDVATLPAGAAHRVFVMGGPFAGGANVVDADSPELKILGLVPAKFGMLLTNVDASRIFVAESFYAHDNRGKREDVISIYDGRTLNLLREVAIPGRLIIVPKPHVFDVDLEGEFGYVYDMVPASRVHVVDLQKGAVLASVDLPGCALALPFGSLGFATICGDGTVGAVNVSTTGTTSIKYSKPFFDANEDPLFESGVIDKASGEAWFLTFSGKIFPAKLGATARIGKPWALTEAAGLPAAGTGVQELAWRPGAFGQVMALNTHSKRLFVLMHPGNFWTHKANGTEVWVIDTGQKRVVRRIPLEQAGRSISVSEDDASLVYVSGADGDFTIFDGNTGEKLRSRKLPAGMATVAGQ